MLYSAQAVQEGDDKKVVQLVKEGSCNLTSPVPIFTRKGTIVLGRRRITVRRQDDRSKRFVC